MNLKWTGILAGALLLTASHQSVASEGLKLSLQCSNVVLSWPSSDTNNEYFLVQYRPTLGSTDQWQTIGSWIPAESGTNQTTFVHSNVVQYPNCAGSSSLMQSEALMGEVENLETLSPFPLAMRADGSSSAVPLNLYPPGFDFTGFLLLDPVSGEWVNGAGYSMQSFSETASLDPEDPGIPGDPQEGGGITISPETGFYRVVRHGVALLGVTNGMTLSGTHTFKIEVGAETGHLESLSVRENGTTIGNSAALAPFTQPLEVVIDTTTMTNGTHQISAFASWTSGDESSGFDAESEVFTVNVFNEITFPNWIEHFGELYDSLLLTAESAHLDADWYIDIYGANAGYIGTFGGHTTDGHIYAWWDLVGPPPNYTVYTNEPYFDFVISTEWTEAAQSAGSGPQLQAAAGSSSASKRTYRQTDNWTSKGMWVVANQQAWNNLIGHDMLDIATDGFVQAAEINSLTVRPTHPYNEAFRIGYGEEIAESTRNAQWAALKSAVFHPESRNFFYFGHGSPGSLGASASPSRLFTANEIAAGLHTIPAGQTNRHGYRFVFLYGCETASGTLPEAFGIVHRENVPLIDFQNAALTPGAFVGWNQQQAAGVIGSSLTDNAFYLQHFQLEWSQGVGVYMALKNAKDNYPDVGFINFSKPKIYGNWELSYWSFNR